MKGEGFGPVHAEGGTFPGHLREPGSGAGKSPRNRLRSRSRRRPWVASSHEEELSGIYLGIERCASGGR